MRKKNLKEKIKRDRSFLIITIPSIIVYILFTVLDWTKLFDHEKSVAILGGIIVFDLIAFILTFGERTEKFKESLGSIPSTPDVMFEKYKEKTTQKNEEALIQQAQKKVELLQETCEYILTVSESNLETLIKNGGNIHIVTCLPTKQCFTYVSMRNLDMKTATKLIERWSSMMTKLNDLKDITKDAGIIGLRYCPYPIALTQTIIDSNQKNSRMIVRFADFRVELERKLGFYLSQAEKNTYNFYKKQFDYYSLYSYKKIIVDVKTYESKKAFNLLANSSSNIISIDICEANANETIQRLIQDPKEKIIVLKIFENTNMANDELTCFLGNLKKLLDNREIIFWAIRNKKKLSEEENYKLDLIFKNVFVEVIPYSDSTKDALIKEMKASVELINILKGQEV